MSAREQSPQPDPSHPPQIFTLEINGRPTLVFEAIGLAEASEICSDADLRSDLGALTSDGISICADNATLAPRPAVPEEIRARPAPPLSRPSVGASPSGKAGDFDSPMRRFESSRPSQAVAQPETVVCQILANY